MRRLLPLILLALASAAQAAGEEPPGLIPIPEQPDLPPPVENGQPIAPDVTITRKGKDIVEEYRVNNRLYMIKIKPSVGPSYYLMDTDGDGTMDYRGSDIVKGANTPNIPQWVLFSW